MRVVDEVMGRDERDISIYFHFHPMWSIQPLGEHYFRLMRDGGGEFTYITVDDRLTWSVESDRYYPEFGKDCANFLLAGRCQVRLPVQLVNWLSWGGRF